MRDRRRHWRRPKPHENGVIIRHEYRKIGRARVASEGWHWAATPGEAFRRYADFVERLADQPGSLIKLVQNGAVVLERRSGSGAA